MKSLPFISPTQAAMLLRIAVALIMMAHGAMRLYMNSLNDFGKFLDSKGFIFGTKLAWTITIFELVGGLLMIANFFTTWIAMFLIAELIMGIILVHAQNGWFVVGHQSGGIEYSVLLIICLLVIAANSRKQQNISK